MLPAAQEFQREVAVGHRIHGIGHGVVEAELLRRHVAVDGKRGAGQGARAQGAFVQPQPRIGEPAAVPPEHLDVGSQQMVAERHRLRGLEMRRSPA